MNEILNKILTEVGYDISQSGEIIYYHNNNKAYFFSLNVIEEEVKGLRSYSDFEKNGKYQILLSEFNESIKRSSNTIEKNSTLLIFVKCSSLESLESLKQQILLLEEDEYFFKKYVIIYSDNSILKIQNLNPVIHELQSKINDEKKFEIYANSGYKIELEEYLLILQLFIKLPFLKLSFSSDSFKSLELKIQETLGEDLSKKHDYFLNNFDAIIQADFTNPNSVQTIDEIIRAISND